MERIYMNHRPGEERIHVEITSSEVSDLLDDLQADPEHYDSTSGFLVILHGAEETFSPVVAEGRRDLAARTASGQQPCVCDDRPEECDAVGQPADTRTATVPCGMCGNPWSDSHGIHAGDRCTPAVGQPAEAQATEARRPQTRWHIEGYDADEWNPCTGYQRDREAALKGRESLQRRYPDMPTRLVRETTTWTVEDER